MQLLTDEDRAALPPLYGTEGQGEAAAVRVRLFLPGTYWEWFVVEFDGDDLLWGLANGHEAETGYFSLAELEDTPGTRRDDGWQPRPLAEVMAQVAAARRPRTHVIDFTDRRPGDDDPSGGTFERCPRCGKTGRVVEYPTGGRTYVHTLVSEDGGIYLPAERCFFRDR